MDNQTNKQNNVRLFSEERRSAILDMLEQSPSILVSDVAKLLNVSTVTARSDLDALERDGKLRRTRGGAVSLHKTVSVSIQEKRMNVHVEQKHAIASLAIDLVQDYDTLIVDSGTTALEFVRQLGSKKHVTIITNDITIANTIDESLPNLRVVTLGGTLRRGHRYAYGPLTLAALDVLHADLAVLTPASFIPNRGFMASYEQMAELKTAFMKSADKRLVLLDADKINKPGIMRFAQLEDIDDIIMDSDPDNVMHTAIEQARVSTHLHLAN